MAPTGFFAVVGSGNVVSESREARDFDQITLFGVGTVTVTQTGEESLTIEAEDNILPLLTSEVRERELVLGVQHGANISPRARIHFIVTVDSLRGLRVSGAGNIEVARLTTDTLRLAISGTGNLTAPEVATESLQVDISGAGNIDLKRLSANEVEATLSGTGSVTLVGHATRQEISLSGAGSYEAAEFASEQARVKVSGVGSARVNVGQRLDAKISGIGSIYYTGQPQITRSVSGLGSIRPL